MNKGEFIDKLVEAGIIDPTKVTRQEGIQPTKTLAWSCFVRPWLSLFSLRTTQLPIQCCLPLNEELQRSTSTPLMDNFGTLEWPSASDLEELVVESRA